MPLDCFRQPGHRLHALQPLSRDKARDIQRVAKKYYDAGRLQIVAVGDAKELSKVLEKYGTVEPASEI